MTIPCVEGGDLACCAGTMASYSTPSDLVRVGLASDGSINGELAGW